MRYAIFLVVLIIVGYFCLPVYFAFQAVIFGILLVFAIGIYIIYKALGFYEKFLTFKDRICARFKIGACYKS